MPLTEMGKFFGVMSIAAAPARKTFGPLTTGTLHPDNQAGRQNAPLAIAVRRNSVRREIPLRDFTHIKVNAPNDLGKCGIGCGVLNLQYPAAAKLHFASHLPDFWRPLA